MSNPIAKDETARIAFDIALRATVGDFDRAEKIVAEHIGAERAQAARQQWKADDHE